MKNRLNYRGGAKQIDRMNKDKLKSLKKALLYSYQAATAILSDGREFRCLINPNKLSMDLDDKILSIPFRDICLNRNGNNNPENPDNGSSDGSINKGEWGDMEDIPAVLLLADESIEGSWGDMGNEEENIPDENLPVYNTEEEDIGIKEGDVITWKENGSHWLVSLRRLEETAYFRANIRRCRYELTLGNGSKYWAYIRGPVEQSILWTQTQHTFYNQLNYSLVMHISQTEESLQYFHRFKRVMINGKPWEVQMIDSLSTPGILEVALKETFSNTIKDDIEKAVQNTIEEKLPEKDDYIPYIYGKSEVFPYDILNYEIKNYEGGAGSWHIVNETRRRMVKLEEHMEQKATVTILTGKSGSFTLEYREGNAVIAKLDIIVKSL